MTTKQPISYDGDKEYIFLSYSHKNKEEIFEIAEHLQHRKFRFWYDEGIDPGTEWDENIADHIEQAGYFIAFISKEYLESENCKDELNYARDLNKDRLLVYLEDVELPSGMKMRLNRLQAIHKYVYDSEQLFYDKLFSAKGIAAFCEEESCYEEIQKCEEFLQSDEALLVAAGRDYGCISRLIAAVLRDCEEKAITCSMYYAQDWIMELIDAIRADTTKEAREKWIHTEVLCIDGLEQVAGKAATQEELVYVIRKRMELGRKTILLSQEEMPGLQQIVERSLAALLKRGQQMEVAERQ